MSNFNSTTPFSPSQELLNTIADALADKGYIILENALPLDMVSGLYNRITSLQNLHKARIGRGIERKKIETIRSDKTLWLEGQEESEQGYLLWIQSLKQGLNQELYMGLAEYEAHFSHYEEGSFYKKHLDVLKGENKRLLTTVFYLTKDWKTKDGGELLIYEEGETIIEKVPPKMNTLVLFLSDTFAHEVLVSNKDRYSIAGWFKSSR